MLSTITPLSERARGRSFVRSAIWFLSGACLGGAILGGSIYGLAVAVQTVPVDQRLRGLVALVAVAVCVAADGRIAGVRLPDIPRQVDETWVNRFRPWVYAGGFGLQIGAGLLTYVMTAGLYALIVATALLEPPTFALVVGVTFGFVRGATVFFGVLATTPPRLQAMHRWFSRTDRLSLATAMALQIAVMAACVALVGIAPSWLLVAGGLGLATASFYRLRARTLATAGIE
jgi:hypothetical protein